MEGLTGEGMLLLATARDRYSGVKRNPYNDIECGDHYARAMAGWSMLDALSGQRFNAANDTLGFAPTMTAETTDAMGAFRVPFVTGSGWGMYEHAANGQTRLTVHFGEVRIRTLSIPASGTPRPSETVRGSAVEPEISHADGRATIAFTEPVVLVSGEVLEISGQRASPSGSS